MEAANLEKYIGVVKWFHDHAKDADYGFIEHPELGDLFFHEKSIIKNQESSKFKQGQVVTFNFNPAKKDRKIISNNLQELPTIVKNGGAKKNPEAYNILLLENETDIIFLLREYLVRILEEKILSSLKTTIQAEVYKKIISLEGKIESESFRKEVIDQYKEFIKSVSLSPIIYEVETIKKLLRITKTLFDSSYSEIIAIIEEKTNDDIRYKLWIDKYIEVCPVNYIASFIFKADDLTRSIVFNRCSSQGKRNIFFRFIYVLEHIDTDFKLDTVRSFLKLTKQYAKDEYDNILNAALNICPDYYKLNLWLEDFHENLDFNRYKLYTIALPTSEQKRFVKKVLKYIHEEKVNINIEELTSINTIDYDTSKKAQQIDNSRLDYSTSIILNVISELKNQTNIEERQQAKAAQQRMYDLIIRQIKDPADILEITGFFDACEGRCKLKKETSTNQTGEVVEKNVKYRDENDKPRLHPICDGRKAMNQQTDRPALSEETHEFWWCANKKCFDPSRRLHTSGEWENYNLLDFLTILNVKFNEKHLEIYLNLINKANRFLNHLKCRSCFNILRPQQKSNYAFYGVNLFHCFNKDCSENGKPIYIIHCLNGFCEDTIDSRDNVKCMPTDHDQEKCGWYVCNNCLSCCSNESLERREYIFKATGQEYKCHLEGHRDQGIICCNKCGTPMESNIFNEDDYNKALNWFIENKGNTKYIIKSDKNQKGKWWFLFKKGNMSNKAFREKLLSLQHLGFHIPNIEDKDKDVQLIAERKDARYTQSEILICSNLKCRNTIDLSSDLERSSLIKRFHKSRFAPRTEMNSET